MINVTIMSLPSTKPLGRSYYTQHINTMHLHSRSWPDGLQTQRGVMLEHNLLRLLKGQPQESCALQVVDLASLLPGSTFALPTQVNSHWAK